MTSLWMGNLEPYMDEMFVMRAFATMGELVISVKIMRNKTNRNASGYCFVEVANEATAERCIKKINGKLLPGATPPKRFVLNRAHNGKPENRNNRFSQQYSYDHSQLYQPCHDYSYYTQWGYDQNTAGYPAYDYSSYDDYNNQTNEDTSEDDGLEEPSVDLDVVEANRRFMKDSEELYDAFIDCHWPALDLPQNNV